MSISNWLADQRFSHGRLLTHIVEEEYRTKRDNARQLRLKHARLPEPWVIETFPFERQPKLNKKKIMALYDSLGLHDPTARTSFGWEEPAWARPALAISFLIHAIDQGYSARYVLFANLVDELYQSVADHSEDESAQKVCRLRLFAHR